MWVGGLEICGFGLDWGFVPGASEAHAGTSNHRSGDASCRNTWLLALGNGISKGETDRPIRHIDVAATAGAMLGVSTSGLQGEAARELL